MNSALEQLLTLFETITVPFASLRSELLTRLFSKPSAVLGLGECARPRSVSPCDIEEPICASCGTLIDTNLITHCDWCDLYVHSTEFCLQHCTPNRPNPHSDNPCYGFFCYGCMIFHNCDNFRVDSDSDSNVDLGDINVCNGVLSTAPTSRRR